MKKHLLAAAALLAIAVSPNAGAAVTTYSVINVTASLSCSTQAANGIDLVTVKLTTNDLINIALGQPLTTKNPNKRLGFAGEFADFGNVGNHPGNVKLVVVDISNAPALTFTIVGEGSNPKTAENRIENNFIRNFVGTLTFQSVGGFTGGSLQIGGSARRKPNEIADPAKLKVSAPSIAIGTINATFVKGVNFSGELLVTKGKFKASGKILGTFDL